MTLLCFSKAVEPIWRWYYFPNKIFQYFQDLALASQMKTKYHFASGTRLHGSSCQTSLVLGCNSYYNEQPTLQIIVIHRQNIIVIHRS